VIFRLRGTDFSSKNIRGNFIQFLGNNISNNIRKSTPESEFQKAREATCPWASSAEWVFGEITNKCDIHSDEILYLFRYVVIRSANRAAAIKGQTLGNKY